MRWHNLQSYIGTLKEYAKAVEDGAHIKALYIRVANPELSVKFARIEESVRRTGFADVSKVA